MTETSDESQTVAFDTLKYAKRMKEAGFNDVQAEALADATLQMAVHNLATKGYIDAALARAVHLLTVRMIAVAIVAVGALWIIIRS
jgi:hypothetical protein